MAIAEKELVVRAGRASTTTDIEAAAKPIIARLEAHLTDLTNTYTAKAMELAHNKTQGSALAEPFTIPFAAPVYNWWDMFLYGPFQVIPGGAAGPFLPSKIIRSGEVAFMIAAIWRNPAPIAWAFSGPSAATVMSAYDFQLRLESINLSTVVDGPDFVPAPLAPIGPGFLNFVTIPLTFGAVPAPAQGAPNLYELNLTADVTGPVAGLPFAGYSTWLLEPEAIPPFWFLPPVAPVLRQDVPARVLVYTA